MQALTRMRCDSEELGCFDVGVQCGGWGHIVVELSVEDRDKLTK